MRSPDRKAFAVYVERRRKHAGRVLARLAFNPIAASVHFPKTDCYFRRLPYHRANLRAFVNQEDGEISLQLEHEDNRGTQILCKTHDPAEVENLLTRRFRPRFPRD